MYTLTPSFLLLPIFTAVRSQSCGQDSKVLGNWFLEHGSPDLLLPPYPPLIGPLLHDPYRNSRRLKPPPTPNPREVCGMQW
ncbi:uncharacterized protein LOC111717946 isoform X2 [Eurytemora carolleeae]|nr:uncharacterized protein LOC111717946 isoform X2 [Eurytemora carolleeae]|eukprot:XP_023349184.1 uncharacterized protein LOC111717946 isoform X2 [Eurytemora affinis]